MGRDLMGYDVMAQDALRGLVRRALQRAAGEGLPGDHHFYINFATAFPGVVMPDSLRERFPNDMIIVLQHQFWDLEAGEDEFSVTLQFNKMPQRLTIPYKAVISFVDPSVQFGLRFQVEGYEPREELTPTSPPALPETTEAPRPPATREPVPDAPAASQDNEQPGDKEGGSAEVVNLDKFRKK
ncbi:MAG: SspB family protein [Alphaproteobacteria bacterium]